MKKDFALLNFLAALNYESRKDGRIANMQTPHRNVQCGLRMRF